MKVSRETARHYLWGGNCDGWHLLESDPLSVIQERIPPGGGEQRHYHEKARQLFYILGGVAGFESEGEEFVVKEGEGYRVDPGVAHRIWNAGSEDLFFLVISAPKSHGDRVNL